MGAIRKLWNSKMRRVVWRVIRGLSVAATMLLATGTREPQFMSLVIFLLVFWLTQSDTEPVSKSIRVTSALLGACFALLCVLAQYAFLERINGTFFCFDTYWSLLMAWICFDTLLQMIYVRLTGVRLVGNDACKWTAVQVFWLCFACLTIVYTVCFLCHYPGNVMADMRTQLVQMVGLDPYSNHHPMAHTLAMEVFFELGRALFHTQNAGVACITISQYLAVAAVFAYVVSTMRRFGVRMWAIVASMLFFAFAPNNLLFAITPVKDIPFGIMTVLLITVLWRLLDGLHRGIGFKGQMRDWILLLISSVGVCVLRTNGIYAFVPFIVLCAVLLKGKQLRMLPVMGGALLIALVFRGPVLTAMRVPPPDTVEALSLPVQHISRVIVDGHTLSEADAALLGRVVDLSAIPDTYEAFTSDPIKGLVRETDNQAYIVEHKKEFLSLWLRLGRMYPKSYLYAQIDETVGFWYPNIQYESLYLGGIHPESTRLDISTEPKLTGLIPAMLNKYLTGPRYRAVFALTFSIGTATWIAIVFFGMAAVHKKRALLLPYLFVFLVLGTLLVATPVHAEFRYLYSLFAALPLLCCFPFVTEPAPPRNTAIPPETSQSEDSERI